MANIAPEIRFQNEREAKLSSAAAADYQVISAAIGRWAELTLARRRNLASSVRIAAAILSRDMAPIGIPDAHSFICRNLNRVLYAGPPAMFGLNRARFANVQSDLRAVLTRLGWHDRVSHGGRGLSSEWRVLREALGNWRRMGLGRFLVYCSAHEIAPLEVTERTLDEFERWLEERTLTDDIGGLVRRTASSWNWAAEHVPGWPVARLTRAGMRSCYTIPLNAYPASFQAEVGAFLGNLSGDPGDDGLQCGIFGEGEVLRPRRVLRPRTIGTRRWQIRQAAGALVRSGMKPEEITSLDVLVSPIIHVRTILHFLKKRTQERLRASGIERALAEVRSTNISGVGEVLRQIAKFKCRLPSEHVAQIKTMQTASAPSATGSMSEKNATRLTALVVPRTMAMLLHMPSLYFLRLAAREGIEPRKAALLAMYATLLEIALICPLRRSNLAALHLDHHFLWSPDHKKILAIVITAGEVKNSQAIHWPLHPDTARLIRGYIVHSRPLLTDDACNRWLFPNGHGGPRSAHDLAVELSTHVEKALGVAFNMHLLRHFAVWRFLKHHPGAYEAVRLVLGHRSVETTIRFYAGLEAAAAAQHYDDLLSGDRRATKHVAAVAFGRMSSREHSRRGA